MKVYLRCALILFLASLSGWAADNGSNLSCPAHSRETSVIALDPLSKDCSLPALGERRRYTIKTALQTPINISLEQVSSPNDKPALVLTVPVKYRGDKKATDEVRERAEKCFQRYSPHLIGPNGEHLTIRLASKSETRNGFLGPILHHGRFEAHDVRIDKTPRSNSEEYDENETCETILHETLHLLGLVDTNLEQQYDYSCRALGPGDSIMTQEYMAGYSVLGMCAPKVFVPQCEDSKDQPTLSQLSDMKEKFRNGEWKNFRSCKLIEQIPRIEDRFASRKEDCERYTTVKKYGKNQIPAYYIYDFVLPWQKSILRKGEFNKIIYPRCKPLNQLYDACAANAYRSKKQGCLEMPLECSSPDWVDQ